MSKNNEIDMINGKMLKKIVIFSIPVVLSGILQLLFNTVDIIVVGKFSGSDSLAAVGATSSLIFLIVGMFMGISMGVSVTMGRFCGARDYKNANDTIHTAITLSIYCGILVLIIGQLLAKPLLLMMGTPVEIIEKSLLYLRIYFFGVPAMLIYNFGSGLFRAIGDTKKPLYFLTVSGITNVILNLVFVIVFDMHVAGVSLATVIANYISATLTLIFLSKSEGYMRLNLRNLHLNMEKVKMMLKVGLPAGLQGILFSISNVLIQSSVNSFGPLVIAGNTASVNIEGFIHISMNSIYQTALSFTSQNFGAKKYNRIDNVFLQCMIIVVAVGGGLGFLAYTFGESLLSLYTTNNEVIMYGMNRLVIISTLYFLCGMMDVSVGVLRGMGYSMLPMIVTLTGVCVFRVIWVFTVFQAERTQFSLYISYPISWMMTSIVQIVIYLVVRRKFIKNN